MAARLTRRVLLSLAAGLTFAPAYAQPDDAVAFVRDFYNREVALHAAKERVSEAVLLSVFTADAQDVWRTAHANRHKSNLTIGPILHVFLGHGQLPGREVTLGDV